MPNSNDLWTVMHPKPPQIMSTRMMTGGTRSRATIKDRVTIKKAIPMDKSKTYGIQNIRTKKMGPRMNTSEARWDKTMEQEEAECNMAHQSSQDSDDQDEDDQDAYE